MIELNKEEQEYILNEFSEMLSNDNSSTYKEQLDEETIHDMSFLIADNNLSKSMNDESLNKLLVKIIYWALGMWYWIDNEYESEEVSEFIKDTLFCDIYKKVKEALNN